MRWARKFYEWDGFDENERNYKLEIAARLEEARDALLEPRRGLDAAVETRVLDLLTTSSTGGRASPS